MWESRRCHLAPVLTTTTTTTTIIFLFLCLFTTDGQCRHLSSDSESESESSVQAFTEIPPDSPRIINGEEAPAGRWPFMVSLQNNGRHFCGGTILTADSILTAAHCLFVSPVAATAVYIGHVDKSTPDPKYVYQARSFHPDPAFSFKTYNTSAVQTLHAGHDIGVIKLARPIDLAGMKNMVLQVCLPNGPKDEPISDKCIALGWGVTKGGSRESPAKLRQVALPLMPPGGCMRGLNDQALYCAGYENGQKGVCNGDSGSALMCPSKSDPNTYLQYGIASFVSGACISFGYFTKPVTYVAFIRSKAEGG